MTQVTALTQSTEENNLKQGLKKRHLLMISLGGTIGSGLFIGVAAPLQTVGPLGTILAYLMAGLVMLGIVLCLGELSCAFPHSGSFQHYALMFLPSPIWSYTIGWLYWLSWVLSMAANLTAAAFIVNQFIPTVPIYLLSFIILVLITSINLISVRAFGESEYILSTIKVLAIVVFILVGLYLITKQYHVTQTIPTLKTTEGWFPNGFFSIFLCMTIVAYSFQGVELIGSAAGETESPELVLPKLILGIAVRIILFYVFAIAILAMIYPYNLPNSLVSPFAWVFKEAGIPAASTIMLFVIFCAAISSSNSAIYASSRMLWSMAQDNLAPKCFAKVNKRGVPVASILIIAAIALVSLASKYIAAEKLYIYLVAGTGQVGCLAWIAIAWCQHRFRDQVNQGKYPPETIKFRSPWFPWLARISIFINIVIITGLWFDESGMIILLSEIIITAVILASYPLCRRHLQKKATV